MKTYKFKNVPFEEPGLEQVVKFFEASKYSRNDAKKFFYHYSAIDWTVGRSKCRNWRALAMKWQVELTRPGSTTKLSYAIKDPDPQTLKEIQQIKQAYKKQKASKQPRQDPAGMGARLKQALNL